MNRKEIDHFPSSTSELAKIEPIYEEFEGWKTSTEFQSNGKPTYKISKRA